MHLGIADHLGWAVAVLATTEHEVVDRRRIELIEDGLPTAPIHHEGGQWRLHDSGAALDDDALAELVATVRASAVRATGAALDKLSTVAPEPVVSMSVRRWNDDLPADVAAQRRVPYESRADSVMYRRVLAEGAGERGWTLCRYDAKSVEQEALTRLGARSDQVLRLPRTQLGPPWTKDHRVAFAATIVAS